MTQITTKQIEEFFDKYLTAYPPAEYHQNFETSEKISETTRNLIEQCWSVSMRLNVPKEQVVFMTFFQMGRLFENDLVEANSLEKMIAEVEK